jgi:hypothetical protein
LFEKISLLNGRAISVGTASHLQGDLEWEMADFLTVIWTDW